MACEASSNISLTSTVSLDLVDLSREEFSTSLPDRCATSKVTASKAEEELRALKTLIASDIQSTSSRWIRDIDAILERRKVTEVIVGIAGATGSGKSTLLNELLMEDNLVPTNPMRACTAAITKVSHNSSKAPRYKASITFVSEAAWKAELLPLFDDFRNEVAQEDEMDASKDKTMLHELDVAFAKVQAVYPYILDRASLVSASVDGLMNDAEVQACLGEELSFEAETAEDLAGQMKQYIDTQSGAHKKDDHTMQYWPIIEEVHIYAPSPILATGATIVDLPGGSDSNAARTVVAETYLRKCTALWIAASSVRAMDDGYGRDLLEQGLQRQLTRDGTFRNTTFICTKSDQIVVRDARRTFIEDPKFSKNMNEIDQKRNELRANIKACKERIPELQNEVEVLKAKSRSLRRPTIHEEMTGNRNHTSLDSLHPNKGKLTAAPPFKRRKLESPSVLPEKLPSPLGKETFVNSHPENVGLVKHSDNEQSPQEQCDPKFKHKALQKELRKLRRSLENDAKRLKELNCDEWKTCVNFRNQHATTAILENFTNNLNELGQTSEEDSNDLKNDQLFLEGRRDLQPQVFCVSSNEYHRLHARSGNDSEDEDGCRVEGFSNETETGIPALQEHLQKIGLIATTEANEAFINMAQKLITSFGIWSSKLDPQVVRTETQQTSDQIQTPPIEDLVKVRHTHSLGTLANICRHFRIFSRKPSLT